MLKHTHRPSIGLYSTFYQCNLKMPNNDHVMLTDTFLVFKSRDRNASTTDHSLPKTVHTVNVRSSSNEILMCASVINLIF